MKTISEFLDLYPGTKNTRNVYRAGIYTFLDSIYGKQRDGYRATKEDMEDYESLMAQYLSENRDYSSDLMEFAAKMNGIPPHTAKSNMTGIREFLAVNGIELKHQELKRIRTKLPKGTTRTIEKDLDHETLKTILQHLDVKGRALFLSLASSGMRIGEILQLNLDDINLKSNPVEIMIRGEYTKTGEQRFTFISDEAALAVREWLKVRSPYIELAEKRTNGFIKKGRAKGRQETETRLFPFSVEVAAQMWKNALTKAGLYSIDNGTKRKQLHPHMLRKFFRSQMALKVPVDIVETLMGHSGYLTDAYRRFTKKQIADFYKDGMYLVTLTVPKEIKEIESEFKQKIQNHSEILESIVKENIQLKQELADIKEKMKKLDMVYKFIESHQEID